METIPASHCFCILNGSSQLNTWDEAIQKLKADEKQNPQPSAADEKTISYYEQLEDNLKQMENLAAAYRQSDNDPNLGKQIKILMGRDETLNQLIGLNTYIQSLKDDTTKNPQDAAENERKIANAEKQEQCIHSSRTLGRLTNNRETLPMQSK